MMARNVCPFDGIPMVGLPAGEGGLGGLPGTSGSGGMGTMMGGGGGGLGSYGQVQVRSRMQPSSLPGKLVYPNQSDAFAFTTLP